MVFTKICSRCKESKDISMFKKYFRAGDWLWKYCKQCDKNKKTVKYKFKNYKVKNKEYYKDLYKKQRIDRLAKAKVYYENNKDAIKQRVSNYVKNNKGKINSYKAKYRASKYNATPKWLTKDQLKIIAEFYKKAKRMSEETGKIHHVDHIIPLQGKNICGLHVPWNLQILSQSENCSKTNKLIF